MSVAKQQGPQVTWADQLNINAFGRCHNRTKEIELEIEGIQKENELIKDALTEIDGLLEDEGCVKIKIGEVYFEVNNDKGIELINQILSRKEDEIKALQKECDGFQGQIDALKEALYAKFGDSIRLD